MSLSRFYIGYCPKCDKHYRILRDEARTCPRDPRHQPVVIRGPYEPGMPVKEAV